MFIFDEPHYIPFKNSLTNQWETKEVTEFDFSEFAGSIDRMSVLHALLNPLVD